MRLERAAALAAGLALGLGAPPPARAGAVLIRAQSRTVERLLDGMVRRRGLARRAATRVVPAYSVGRRAWVGAYQVAGAAGALASVRTVFEIDGKIADGRGRFVHLVPSTSSNPLTMDRVRDVAVVAAVDSPAWDELGTFTTHRTLGSGSPRALAAVSASRAAAAELDDAMRELQGFDDSMRSRVVPLLAADDWGYTGMAQVIGPGAGAAAAVVQLEETLGGQYRARIFVPVGASLDLGRPVRVEVGTLIDVALDTPILVEPGPAIIEHFHYDYAPWPYPYPWWFHPRVVYFHHLHDHHSPPPPPPPPPPAWHPPPVPPAWPDPPRREHPPGHRPRLDTVEPPAREHPSGPRDWRDPVGPPPRPELPDHPAHPHRGGFGPRHPVFPHGRR